MTMNNNDIPFVEYNNWPNKPTWTLPQILEGKEPIALLVRQRAEGLTVTEWKKWFLGLVKNWKRGWGKNEDIQEAITLIITDFLMDSLDYIDYRAILDALHAGKPTISTVPHFHSLPLTQVVLTLFSLARWQELLEQSTEPGDVTLHDWLRDHCLTWVQSSEVRRHREAIHLYIDTVLMLYFDAVAWEKVVRTLKGE